MFTRELVSESKLRTNSDYEDWDRKRKRTNQQEEEDAEDEAEECAVRKAERGELQEWMGLISLRIRFTIPSGSAATTGFFGEDRFVIFARSMEMDWDRVTTRSLAEAMLSFFPMDVV